MTYSQKLKDPRWQKKRLEIFKRDKFACTHCGDNNSELHLHHFAYEKGEPWDVDSDYLTTLCIECHEKEEHLVKFVKEAIRDYSIGFGTISPVYENLKNFISHG